MTWFRRLLSRAPSTAPTSRRAFLAGAGAFAGGVFLSDDADARPLDIEPGTLVDAQGRPLDRAATPSSPFIGAISLWSASFAPRGWAFCDGQLLPVAQNLALFSLLGTTYGGDGQTTFALPDFRGRVPVHSGNGPGLTARSLGEVGGNASGNAHSHNLPTVQVRGAGAQAVGATRGGARGSIETATAGSGDNRQPFLTLNFIIALIGIYPSRS